MTEEISELPFDVIVIGAGINGAGIARDAALRGLKVLLLDKGDIGGGTSSLSTRLIHGGLRYLEHGEFGLVRESLRERACLMKIAPHLVRPLRMVAPIYQTGRRGVWTMRAGMIAYDLLSFANGLSRHRLLTRAETLRQLPGLSTDGLLGAAVFFDAQVEFAERLVVENVLSAVAHGATVVTYARVDKLLVADGTIRGVEFTNQFQIPNSKLQSQADTGTAGVAGSPADVFLSAGVLVSPADRGRGSTADRYSAHARVVVNAAGPWVDELLDRTGAANSSRLIGGTKGSHIIVAPFAGAPDTAIYVEAETDGRPFFIIPWNNNYLIGTTDLRYEGDLDDVRIDADETDYLLRETNRVIPAANLTRGQVLYTYSGVRPLAFSSNTDEQRITRKHFIRQHPRVDNLFSIVGGKLTTFRSLAEEAVDLINKLRQSRDRGHPARSNPSQPKCRTAQDPLPGAAVSDFAAFSKDFKQRCGLPEASADRLLRIYGTRASLILEMIANDASLAAVFDDEAGAIGAEIVFAFRFELAQTLSDCLLRRTMVGLNSSCGLNAVEAAASVAQQQLGWSESRVKQEIDAYREEIGRRLTFPKPAQRVEA